MRHLLLAVLIAFAAVSPARAQQAETAEHILARILVEALAPASYGNWAYDWGAVSSRISRHMHWHLPDPDPRDRPPNAEIRRNGWVEAPGRSIQFSAHGDDDNVRSLQFRLNDTTALTPALRAAGATVEVIEETPARSSYRITPRDRRTGVLTREHLCTSPRSRAARRCWDDYVLTFER